MVDKPSPIPLTMVICDTVIDDRKTGKKSLIGLFNNINADRVFISAKEKQNMQELVDKLLKATQIPQIGENDVIVTNLRHYEALSQALVAIRRVQKGLQEHISGDFLSQDVRECLHFLGEITGQITTDEVLGNIFSRFCIGK